MLKLKNPTSFRGDKMSDTGDLFITLRDGRNLAYAEYGDPQGKPIFYFHGFPGSHWEAKMVEGGVLRNHVRIIAVDRPGFGKSDFQPGRKFSDWPKDVVELADNLGLEKFGVMGASGGGPYVLVCALNIPERLTHAGVIAGVGPFTEKDATRGMKTNNILLFKVGKYFPGLLHLLFRQMAGADMKKQMDKMLKSMPEPDQKVLMRPELSDVMISDVRESFLQGTRGAVHENMMYANPWDFNLRDIQIEVLLWQGEKDTNVPPVMGHFQAKAIPHCKAKFFPEEGHISLPFNNGDEIIRAMVE
jgi:pimeloyl-ACP methyl ester carboxylesterase